MNIQRDPLLYVPHLLALMVSALFFFTAALKILQVPAHLSRMDTLGFSAPLLYGLGAIELIVAALLIVPNIRVFGAALGLAVLANMAYSQMNASLWVDFTGSIMTSVLLVSIFFTHRAANS